MINLPFQRHNFFLLQIFTLPISINVHGELDRNIVNKLKSYMLKFSVKYHLKTYLVAVLNANIPQERVPRSMISSPTQHIHIMRESH